MSNSYYNGGAFPATGAPATSASMRAELSLISGGFDKLPTLSGNANKLVVVNPSASALEAVSVLPPLTITDTNLVVEDNADSTRKFRFEATSVTAGATRVLTVPDANTTLVGTDAVQTLTNKTITGGSLNNTPIGAATANTGAFTTLAASGNVTLSGGTANGVLYLNGSKVATSGSALTFDGTNFTTTGYAAGNGIRSLGGNAVRFYNSANANWSQISAPAGTGDMQFDTGAGEQMRLTSTGLGIGTSSPGVRLDAVGVMRGTFNSLSNGGSTAHGLVLRQSTTDTKALVAGYSTSGNHIGAYIQAVNFGTAYEDMVLQPQGGNLGLGVVPSAWGAQFRAFEIGSPKYASFSQRLNASGDLFLGWNAYNDSTGTTGANGFKYSNTGDAAALYAVTGTAGHRWYTAPSGTAGNAISFTQAMTLDASGNLALGATSASARLDVVGGSIRVNEDSIGTKIITVRSDYAGLGPAINVTTSHPLLFLTANQERFRITSGGYFKASNTGTYVSSTGAYHEMRSDAAGGIALYVSNSNASDPYGQIINFLGAAPNNATNYFLRCIDTGATRTDIRSNGGIANYQANDVNLSDRREKTNFAPAKSYLDTICAIPVQTFNYIDQSEDDPGLTLGVVAQDVQAVAPELVMESNWGTADEPKQRLSIYQTDLQYALMKCIQEQQALITALTARVQALEGV